MSHINKSDISILNLRDLATMQKKPPMI